VISLAFEGKTPLELPADGKTQSTITVLAQDAQHQPVAGVHIEFGVQPPGRAHIKLPTLSSSWTGTDGRARITITAGDQPGKVTLLAQGGQKQAHLRILVKALLTPTPALAKLSFMPERVQLQSQQTTQKME